MSRLDEIRERWEKATPGPWALDPAFWSPPSWGETMHYRRVVHGEPNEISGIRQPIFSTNGATDGSDQARQNHHDASAVAAAPEDVAWLLAEVKEARDDTAHFEAEYGDAVAEIARRDKVLDQVRVAFLDCFAPDFGGWDWRDDDAVQTLARSLSRALASLNTSSAEVTP